MYTSDKEAIILEHIYNNDSLKQRELADKAGISLGMTNAILKRLIEKGWLLTKRINSRNICYVVSPAGMEELFRQGRQKFKQTIDNVLFYKEEIEHLVSEAVAGGYETVALVGKSDLDFIVEYACGKAGIGFNCIEHYDRAEEKAFVIFSELQEVADNEYKNRWLKTFVLKEKKVY